MSKNFQKSVLTLILTVLLFSCGDKKETPASIAAKWCELNAQVTKAAEEVEKTKALTVRKEFESRMETKYKEDTAMMQAIFQAVETCETTSEGKADKSSASTVDSDIESLLPMAYADAASVAKAFCSFVDQSIQAAQNNDVVLNKIVSAKVIFENNMNESYQNNPERRDSVFKLIEPCVAKEVQFRSR